jgi:hypothetical protein
MTVTELRVEGALRDVYRGRVASMASADLVVRIATIPAEIRPERPRWILPAAIAGLAAVLVAAVATYDRLRSIEIVTQPPGGPALTTFDPTRPGGGLVSLSGVTFNELRDVMQWLVALIAVGLVIFVAVATMRRWLQSERPGRVAPRPTRRQRIQYWIFLVLSLLVFNFAPRPFDSPPLSAGSVSSSGIGFAERRMDGIQSTVFYVGTGEKPKFGPRDVYAVEPGEPLTYLVSVRNGWPIGIRVLGRLSGSTDPTDAIGPVGGMPTGLGLLRDPTRLDGSIENTRPFAPVELKPGEEVTLVVSEVGRSCADPTASIPTWNTSTDVHFAGLTFVFEAFGIEGVEWIPLSPEVTVPSTCVD